MNLEIIKVVGVVVYMYLAWRKLREDYGDDKVISYLWLSVLGLMLAGRVVFGVINWRLWQNWWDWLLFWERPGINYIGAYFGWLWVTFWVAKSYGWKILPMLEDISKVLLISFGLYLAGEGVRGVGNRGFLGYLFILMTAYGLVVWVEKRYRSFWWYKSGKKGFVWLVANVWIWVALAILTRQYTFLILGLISLVGLVMLGEK
jgi:hypothetical protein